MKIATGLAFFLILVFQNHSFAVSRLIDPSLEYSALSSSHDSQRLPDGIEYLKFKASFGSDDAVILFSDLDHLKWVPELNIVSNKDHDLEKTQISELDLGSFFSGSLRMQIEDNGIYRYLSPAYTVVAGDLRWSSTADTYQYWQYGVGVGAGYSFSSSFSGELNFEVFEDSTIFGISGKILF